MNTLSDIEKEHYSKQLLLNQFDETTQIKLKNAKVLIVGAGGLAAGALPYLASSGIGTIYIMDGDKVERSNLGRQTLFGPEDIGKHKSECAKKHLQHINPLIRIVAIHEYATEENLTDLITNSDVVLDCTDNYKTRYTLSDLCAELHTPMIYAAIHKFEGQLSVLNYQNGPSYRDIFPDELGAEHIPNCVEVGVWSVLPGIMGLYQANEALKICTGIGEVLSGQLLSHNLLIMDTVKTKIKRLTQQS